MLLMPQYGWVTVNIGDFSDRASYLTDVPLDILDAFITTHNTNKPAVITFDAEGWEYFVIVDRFVTYVIDYPYRNDNEYLSSPIDSPILHTIEISRSDLINEFINDLERDYEQWVNWGYDDEENVIAARKLILDEELAKLKLLIKRS